MLSLTRAEAAYVMQVAQGVHAVAPRGATAGDAIDRLGVVQIDTINVIARSQFLVLWSRLGRYEPRALDALLHPGRQTFEYWGHAASIIPMRDYRYFRGRMIEYARHMYPGTLEWMAQNRDVVTATIDRLRRDGPLTSAAFERDPASRRANRWDWYGPKESRRALEALWTTGEIMVHSRRGGQKVYDTRERVLTEAFGNVPDDADLPSVSEVRQHFASRTLSALGVVAPNWIHDYYRMGPDSVPRRVEAHAWIDGFIARGEAVAAQIEGVSDVAALDVNRLADLDRHRHGDRPSRLTLLSPFDSLIWHRERTRALFDYEVTFEAYVPPEKRVFGYYVLAILYRGDIVGRIDLKMARDQSTLVVRGLWLEPGQRPGRGLASALAHTLRDLARFLGARDVTSTLANDAALAAPLRDRLASLGPLPADRSGAKAGHDLAGKEIE